MLVGLGNGLEGGLDLRRAGMGFLGHFQIAVDGSNGIFEFMGSDENEFVLEILEAFGGRDIVKDANDSQKLILVVIDRGEVEVDRNGAVMRTNNIVMALRVRRQRLSGAEDLGERGVVGMDGMELVVFELEKRGGAFTEGAVARVTGELSGGVVKNDDFTFGIKGKKRGFGGFENGGEAVEGLGELVFVLGQLHGLGGKLLAVRLELEIEVVEGMKEGDDFFGSGEGERKLMRRRRRDGSM